MTDPSTKLRNARAFKVVKAEGVWRLNTTGVASATYSTKAEAIQVAKAHLSRKGGVLTVQGANGRPECLTVLGAEAARRLNAIEGITPNASSRALLRQIGTKAQTSAERRAAILGHFKKAGSV